jgi:hypothetical protein
MRRYRQALLLVVLTFASCRRSIVPQQKLPARQVVTSAAVLSPVAASAAEPSTTAVVLAPAAAASATPAPTRSLPTCLAQAAQPFLIDAHLRNQALMTAKSQAEWWTRLQRSIRYRTEQYGYYSGFGLHAWNPRPLASQMRLAKFAGLPVVLHARVIPALQCVEQAIERDCTAAPYRPRSLGGTRRTNTYTGGEVSNHVYGIALDIDPNDNPCCNCVEPWRSNPKCRGKKSEWQRMAMPECWVTAFEQYGFYWLGHDELKDTMHFEFLGDPNKSAAMPTE